LTPGGVLEAVLQEAFQLLLEEADRSHGQRRATAVHTSPVARELAPAGLRSSPGTACAFCL